MGYNKELWKQVIELGKKNEKGIINQLNRDDVSTIIATMEFFGSTVVWMQQTIFDLTTPKFKVYDWLGMCIMSRNNDERKFNNVALKVLINAYLKAEGNIKKFVENLRVEDYDINREWERIKIDIEE